jgi:rRNA maturation RNase YbeY
MGILIDNRQALHKISPQQIQKTAQALLNALDSPDGELSILILDDPQIARLNQQYRDRQGPTNVLSFPMQEGDFSGVNPNLLGDVVISIETAAKEGEKMGITVAERFKFLLIHGILHLFGYDHEKSEKKADQMDDKSLELSEMISKEKIIIEPIQS